MEMTEKQALNPPGLLGGALFFGAVSLGGTANTIKK